MADSEERKPVEVAYESDADEVAALRWTARRRKASDDLDNDGEEVFDREKVKEKFRWSSDGLDDASDGVDGASSEYDKEREDEGGVIGEELDEVSQEDGDEGDLQEVEHVNKEKEKKAVSDEVFVPRYGWFYMHDDRFRSRRYGRRSRGTMTGMKLWDCTDEQKWKHDKFEEMTLQDKSALKSHHQQQRKNQNKGHIYADTKQFGSHDNFRNQNNKTSRTVKGRGPVKYKPIVKNNNLNPSSKHHIPAKLKENTSTSSSPGVSSRALAISSYSCGPRMQQLISTMDSSLPVSNSVTSSHDIFMTQGMKEQYGRSNKYIPTSTQQNDKQEVSLPNELLQRKTISNFSENHGLNIEDSTQLADDRHFTYQPILFPMSAEFLQMGGKMPSYSFSTKQIYQPYSIQNNDNRIPLPQPYPVIEQSPITSAVQTSLPLCGQQLTLHPGNECHTSSKSLAANSSVETRPQTGNFGHDLVGRGSGVLQEALRGSFMLGGSPSLLPGSECHPGNECQTLSKSLAANSSVETLPQTSNFGHDLLGRGSGVLQEALRGSFMLGGSPSILPGSSLLLPKLGRILKVSLSSLQ